MDAVTALLVPLTLGGWASTEAPRGRHFHYRPAATRRHRVELFCVAPAQHDVIGQERRLKRAITSNTVACHFLLPMRFSPAMPTYSSNVWPFLYGRCPSSIGA